MKTKRRVLSILLALVLLTAMLSGCAKKADGGTSPDPEVTSPSPSPAVTSPSPEVTSSSPEPVSPSPEPPHYPVTISTFNYELNPVEFTFEKAPERVVTFWTGPMETMLALGLSDKIICAVGVSRDRILPELQDEFDKIAAGAEYRDFVDSNAAMSKEYAIMLEADFIYGWKSTFSEKTIGDVDYWHENGIGTYMSLNSNDVSPVRTVANEYEDILTMGRIFDVEERAQEIVDNIKAEVDRVTAATANAEKKTVLVIEFLGGGITCYNNTYLAGNMVLDMGGLLLDTPNKLGDEDLLIHNPDVIFLIGSKEGLVEEFVANPAYGSLTSVQNGDVYNLPLSDVYNSGVRTITGLNRIGAALYPDLY